MLTCAIETLIKVLKLVSLHQKVV